MNEKDFMLCEESSEPFENSDAVAEFKEDGRRVAIIKNGTSVSFYGRDYITDKQYPEIAEEVKKQQHDFIIDTEFCVMKDNISNFNLLLSRDKTKDKFKIKMLSKRCPATAMVFDIIELDGQDLRDKPLFERKKILEDSITNTELLRKVISYNNPIGLYHQAIAEKREGIVIKYKSSPYRGGKSNQWLKVKRKERDILKFTGYEDNSKGITLTNDEGIRVQCAGHHAPPVKEAIDSKGFAMVEIERLGEETDNGKHRQIVFKDLVNFPIGGCSREVNKTKEVDANGRNECDGQDHPKDGESESRRVEKVEGLGSEDSARGL